MLPDARKISAMEEECQAATNEIVNAIFKNKNTCTMKDFSEFREKLKLALRHYEFHSYEMVDEEKETISAENFAKSLLVYLPQNQIHKYIKRIH